MIANARRRRTTVMAYAMGTITLVAVATTVSLAVLNHPSFPNLDSADPTSVVPPLGIGALGVLVALRQPRNPTGWLFLFIAVISAASGAEDQYVRYALVTHPGSLPGAVWVAVVNSAATSLIYPTGAVALVLLLLPDGRVPSRRWRPLVPIAVVLAVLITVLVLLSPGPLGNSNSNPYPEPQNPIGVAALQGIFNVAGAVLWFGGLVIMLLAASAPLVRMRRSKGDQRQQLKWIAYAVFVTATVIAVVSFLAGWVLPNWANDVPIVLGFGIALPVAAGIAIFKHRLYDIDIVISRTLVYGALAVFITAVYVGIAVGIGALVGGGGRPNLGLSILATAIVAVGFQPVRERVQHVANRLVYGKRATPYEVLSQFSERVAESYAADDVMPRMARVLAEGTGAERADVWLRSAGTWHQAAVWPLDAERTSPLEGVNGTLPSIDHAGRIVEVRHQGDLLGALGVTKRSGETLTPVEENLLNDLAGQAGLVLKNVGLTSDLQARLVELRASRQRLVTAQDEERRRLERNLHDGAQQHLVALKVKLGLAEMLASRDPEKAKATLQQLKGDADEALETLRDLARGIYPPLLAANGLGAALQSQARKATIAVAVDAGGIGRYGQDIEAAVYFSVLEALQNVQKYAQASAVTVWLRDDAGRLLFDVTDDGRGFDVAATKRGSGLTNLADRIDALGGELTVTSTPGAGTSVRGSVPVPAARAVIGAGVSTAGLPA